MMPRSALALHGIIPPVVTPLREDEELDLPKLREFLEYLLGHGVHGVFVLGTNSEFYAFDEAEKQAIMTAAVEQVAGRVPVLVGTGAESTREVIRLTRLAEAAGADAVSIVTPYFVHPSQRELFEHYRRIAEQTHLPVVLYNNPGTCGGVHIAPETLARLAEFPNIFGIKDSSGDLQNTLEYLRAVPPRVAVLMGRDTLIYTALLSGARGAVPASANIAPALCVRLYEAFARGDLEGARKAQEQLHPVRMCLRWATQPAGVKAALEVLGIPVGPCRGPVLRPDADILMRMRQVLEEAGLLAPRSAPIARMPG